MNPIKHMAIIMDGNGRWGLKHKNSRNLGHKEGLKTVEMVIKYCIKKKIKFLTLYAFSTENWSRESFEVNALMNLINFGVDVKLDEIVENEVKLKFIGDLKGLPKNAQQGVEKCIEATKHFDDFTLTVALNYGGISDILNAFKELQNNGLDLTEENFLAKTQLGNNDLDIFIRTGGDMRLSNFLLPNIGYSELFFTDKLWPEFTANDFEDVLKDFDERNRRFGK